MSETTERAKKNHKSIAKAWEYLAKYASHIDGEVANANDDQLRIVERLTDALAAALATGLRGIEEKLELPDPVVGNAATSTVKGPAIPTSLDEAAKNLAGSKVARELFGDVFVDHYAATRDWEVRENRKWVSDWDLARYFEII